MRLDNSIQTAISNLLKNPILSILRDINFSSTLKQSNFIKRDIGKSPYLVILHFLYMFVINRKISSFIKYSNDSYKKDVYYRLLKDNRYNWRKLLLLTSVKLHKLQKTTDTKVLIIDDTVEIKRGKFIEGSCKNLWSNKEHRTVKGLNIVSLNYSDCYTDMMLDFLLTTTMHKTLGRVKIVFIKTKDNLIPIISTNTNLSDIEIINTYKKRWNIEQGYKDLREYFQFGKEENRIYEAIIARITLSFLAYNLTSYINRVQNEPQTLGNLFRDLECQLETLAISMELFVKILEQIIESQEIVKRNKDLEQIIHMLRVYTKKQLGFMCES